VGINIHISGLDVTLANIDKRVKMFEKDIKEELNEWADGTALKAKQLAPTNDGQLKENIHPDYATENDLKASVTVAVFYAAYVEFGTGKFAFNYVPTLPMEWQDFARLYYVNGKGRMMQHPYLYPAALENNKKLVANLKNIFK
jgi:hypothetical protein